MECPACSNSLMRSEVWGYFIQMCNECGGIWLEKGNFAHFVRGLAASESIPNDVVKFFERRHVVAMHAVKEEDKACPRCRKKLRKFNYCYDSNVILDKCPDCGGIWADEAEIQRAATYLKGDPRADAIGRGMAELGKRDYPDPDPFKLYDGLADLG